MIQFKYFRIIVGFLITVLILAYLFNRIDVSSLIYSIKKIDLTFLILSMCFFSLSCVFRAIMWIFTTKQYGSFTLLKLFGGIMVGYLANNILPLKGGEFVRAHYLSNTGKIPYSSVLSTIFIERIFDIFVVLFLLACSIIGGIKFISLDRLYWALVILVATVIIFAILVFCASRLAVCDYLRLPILIVRIRNVITLFLEPLKCLLNKKLCLIIFWCSICAWACNYLSLLALLYNIKNYKYLVALVLLLFINVGLLIPSSPGSFGIMQVAFLMALVPFNIQKEQALALSFGYQAGLYFVTFFIGLPYYILSNINKVVLRKET